jgi:hypothetical protein
LDFNADRRQGHNKVDQFRETIMSIKLGSIVTVLILVFIAKISFETATEEKISPRITERSPASIDQSYNDHMMRR